MKIRLQPGWTVEELVLFGTERLTRRMIRACVRKYFCRKWSEDCTEFTASPKSPGFVLANSQIPITSPTMVGPTFLVSVLSVPITLDHLNDERILPCDGWTEYILSKGVYTRHACMRLALRRDRASKMILKHLVLAQVGLETMANQDIHRCVRL